MKDYWKWHELKSKIEVDSPTRFFREGNGKNINFQRPVLIFRKFNKEMFWGLPMTSVQKEGKFYYTFSFKSSISTIILSQLRTMSSKRLLRRMGRVNNTIFTDIESKIIALINETGPLRSPRVPFGNL